MENKTKHAKAKQTNKNQWFVSLDIDKRKRKDSKTVSAPDREQWLKTVQGHICAIVFVQYCKRETVQCHSDIHVLQAARLKQEKSYIVYTYTTITLTKNKNKNKTKNNDNTHTKKQQHVQW